MGRPSVFGSSGAYRQAGLREPGEQRLLHVDLAALVAGDLNQRHALAVRDLEVHRAQTRSCGACRVST
jgi:hypothetical protein